MCNVLHVLSAVLEILIAARREAHVKYWSTVAHVTRIRIFYVFHSMYNTIRMYLKRADVYMYS